MAEPLPYQKIDRAILQMVVESTDHQGYPTDPATLATALRPNIPEIDDRKIVDALKRLHPKYLFMCQYLPGTGCVDYARFKNEDEKFFYQGGGFRLRPTPETEPKVQELAALIDKGAAEMSNDNVKASSSPMTHLLPKEILQPKLAVKSWAAFMREEYDVAAFQAMKAVEVAVREASGLPDGLIGTKLMQEAFRDNGPLADMTAEAGERQGRMQLFLGAIGSYKNPHSHRDVDLNDPAEAAEIILLANHLLRIVAACVKAKGGKP